MHSTPLRPIVVTVVRSSLWCFLYWISLYCKTYIRLFSPPVSMLCPFQKTGMCSDYWTEKVPGCPQRRTKAQRNTPQGASLIHDSACLQDQPQEFKDRATLAIACFHLILTLFFSLSHCLEISLFVLSPALHPFHFECTIPPCYFFSKLTSLSFSPCHPSSYSLPPYLAS